MKTKFRNSAICVFLVLLVCVCSFNGCLKYTSNLLEVTGAVNEPIAANDAATAEYQYSPTSSVVPSVTDYSFATAATTVTPSSATASQPSTTKAPAAASTQAVTQTPQTTAPAGKDPSQWTKNEVVEYLSKAVNSAKAYTGNVTAEHSEEFSSLDITKCPGGSMGISLANRIASGVIKPTTETLNFAGGQATNSEGQSVPLLLPKRQGFTLTADGVQAFSAQKNGSGQTLIEITLVSESSTLESPPPYNSGSIGYLDPGEVDLSLVTLKVFNVTYTGSKIIATIDSQDRVLSIAYTVPVQIEVTGSALGITGEFACNATEKESWKVNW